MSNALKTSAALLVALAATGGVSACSWQEKRASDSTTASAPGDTGYSSIALPDSISEGTDTLEQLLDLRDIIDSNLTQLRATDFHYLIADSLPPDVHVFSDDNGPRKILWVPCPVPHERCAIGEYYFLGGKVFLASESNHRQTTPGPFVRSDTAREQFVFIGKGVRGYMRVDGYVHENEFDPNDEVGNLGSNHYDKANELYRLGVTARPPAVAPGSAAAALEDAATDVVSFLWGDAEFGALHLADSVDLYVARDDLPHVRLPRERLRNPREWRVGQGATAYSFIAPRQYRKMTAYVGSHVNCRPVQLATRAPQLATRPHVGVRLEPETSNSCLETWNATFVFDTSGSAPPRLVAVLYDQWEW